MKYKDAIIAINKVASIGLKPSDDTITQRKEKWATTTSSEYGTPLLLEAGF